ncbi:unnamed protein product [Adineta steineri]|uniref:Uncharacterized protein n=1 Tax=Adineta steineri TaxID=433720 RepID=A0A813Z1B8_9BILA|nr:unnamed protein product [Adineta steineri]
MHYIQRVGQYITNLNLFEDGTNDEHIKRNQILSTRFYIIIFIIILFIFTLFTTLTLETTIVTISNPTYDKYEDLYIKYSNTLKCSCQEISISYNKFINIELEYHEICSSDFISQRWIDFLFYENISYFYQLDFRRSAFIQFQALKTLCQQAQLTINDSLIQFYLLEYITPQLVSLNTFTIEIESFIQIFQRTAPSFFQNFIQLFRHMTYNNQLFSAIDNNFFLQIVASGDIIDYVTMNNIYYQETKAKEYNFDCRNNTGVVNQIQVGIFADIIQYEYPGSWWFDRIPINRSSTPNMTVSLPGIYMGCNPIESLLLTTTECFFQEICLNTIISYVNYSTTTTIENNPFKILNNTSNYPPQTTIETLVNELFIEKWIINKSFIQYFNQCQPSYCEYITEEKHNIFYILTNIISLYGGLTIVLRILIPSIIKFYRKKKQQQEIHSIDSSIPKVSIKTRLYYLYQHIINFIRNFNIFTKNNLTDSHIRKNELISTRIFIIVFIICLLTFTLYTFLQIQTKTITINNPTQVQFEQLNNISANNLQCPCRQLSISYKKFIIIQPTYHQICSSNFVSDLWFLNNFWTRTDDYTARDFRHMAPYYYIILLKLCQYVNTTIENRLTQFYANEYVTSQVIDINIFYNEINALIELFQTTTQQSHKQSLDIIYGMTFSNQLISAKITNVAYTIYNDGIKEVAHPFLLDYDNCTCVTDRNCNGKLGFFITDDIQDQDTVPGMYISCYFFDSLLLSTIECFYDDQCIKRIKSYMYPYSNIYNILIPLNTSIPSRYSNKTSFKTIIDNLFIEDWNVLYFYEKYYSQCQPLYCSYVVEQHPDIIFILTRVIGICGGLIVILKFLTKFLVNIFRRKTIDRTSSSMKIYFSLVLNMCFVVSAESDTIFKRIKKKLINLNLFDNSSSNIRTQQITTRIYIIFLLTILIILIAYTSLKNVLINSTVTLTSQNQYENLQILYPNTLNCPCNEISINYQEFVYIKPTYNQICSSDFVNEQWINYLYNLSAINENTYRSAAAAQFITLSSLCQLTQQAVNSSLTQFYATKFTNIQLISSELFETQVDSFIKSFQTSTPHIFKRTLDIVRGLIQGNALMTAYESNWKFTVLATSDASPVYTNPQTYGNSCSCGTSSECTQPAIVTDNYPFGLPGLLIGCYPLETILQSTLECLYNETCLNSIRYFIDENISDINFTILNPFLSSTNFYGINETIQEMVDRLFIDNWYINKSYKNYFQKCHSLQCKYSYIQTFNIIYILLTIISLYEGLSRSLKIILPPSIYIILWAFYRRKTRVTPLIESNNATLELLSFIGSTIIGIGLILILMMVYKNIRSSSSSSLNVNITTTELISISLMNNSISTSSLLINTSIRTPSNPRCAQLTFDLIKSYPMNDIPYAFAIGDLNNDNMLDLIVSRYTNNAMDINFGGKNGTFQSQVTLSFIKYLGYMSIGDVNNDQNDDVIIVNENKASIMVLLGVGDGTFYHYQFLPVGATPFDVKMGDFNNDNNLDIIVSVTDNNVVSLILGYGNGSFHVRNTVLTLGSPNYISIADFNQDNFLDFAVCEVLDNTVSVYLGYGDGNFRPRISHLLTTAPYTSDIGDLNGDGHIDLVIGHSGNNNISILFNYGNGSLQSPIVYGTGIYPAEIGIADFNGDTYLDIVVANYQDSSLLIFMGKGDGSFPTKMLININPNSYIIIVVDLNNDGRIDIITASEDKQTIDVILNTC